MRRLTVWSMAFVLVLASCGGDDSSPATDATNPTGDGTVTSSTTDGGGEAVDLEALVLSSEMTDRGLSPVPGESGEVGADALPAGSVLRLMLEEYGVTEGFATVFASESGTETVIVAAIRFATASGAADAFAQLEEIRSDIDSAAGPVILAATGDPLLGSCATVDLLELEGDVITVWLDTSDCQTFDEESPTVELDCPAELAVDGSAEVIATVPAHYEPLQWRTDADNLYWQEDSQLILGEQTVVDDQVRISISVTDEFSVEGTEADLEAVLFTYSDISAFGGTYRVSGPRVEASCSIQIVAAANG